MGDAAPRPLGGAAGGTHPRPPLAPSSAASQPTHREPIGRGASPLRRRLRASGSNRWLERRGVVLPLPVRPRSETGGGECGGRRIFKPDPGSAPPARGAGPLGVVRPAGRAGGPLVPRGARPCRAVAAVAEAGGADGRRREGTAAGPAAPWRRSEALPFPSPLFSPQENQPRGWLRTAQKQAGGSQRALAELQPGCQPLATPSKPEEAPSPESPGRPPPT